MTADHIVAALALAAALALTVWGIRTELRVARRETFLDHLIDEVPIAEWQPRVHVVEITPAEWQRISTEPGWAATLADIDALSEVAR